MVFGVLACLPMHTYRIRIKYKLQKSTQKAIYKCLFIKNQYVIIGVRDKRVGVRNGSKNMSTWLNTLKYNLSDTIKKWYLFPDLEVLCTTKQKSHPLGWFLVINGL